MSHDLREPPRDPPKPVPGVSPGAKQMGRAAAANLLRRLRGEATRPFHYVDYGNLATVGRKAAVVDLTVPVVGAVRFSGFFAWLFWLFAHIYFLIGFRNRLMVMADWAVAYWTYERSARVVAEPASAPEPHGS
jgi:NADH dehydrogenase